jgi:hypothetical protein
MKEFLLSFEPYKDLADLAIKTLGGLGTIIGAVWVALTYLHDKRDARLAQELALRRDAYFGLFSAIPLQLAALGRYFAPNREPFMLSPEAAISLHKLHLLASQEALQCIITWNATYHEAAMALTAMKNHALDLDEARLALDPPLNELLNKAARSNQLDAERSATMQMVTISAQQIKDAVARRVAAWEAFIECFKSTLHKLNANYRDLVQLARKDIGLDGSMDAILTSMEKDQTLALTAFERSLAGFRKSHDLVIRDF